MRAPRLVIAAVGLALALGAHTARAQPLAPLIVGWERHFTLTWEAGQRGGRPYVEGYLANEAGFPAHRIQLLVEGLAADGRVVGQRVEWFGPGLTPGMRGYFRVPAPAGASTYRVSVFAFDWVQTARFDAP
ncbi:MAG: hypothetical protein ACREM3_22690 [Candidatus Rokuibacteriota bacterium]